MINNEVGIALHRQAYAIIGSSLQEKTCDNRDCDIRRPMAKRAVAEIKTTQPEAIDILQRVDSLGLTQRELATALGISENKISKVRSAERRFTAGEVLTARDWLAAQTEKLQAFGQSRAVEPDQPTPDAAIDYVEVEVLPTYAGMGGGGTGEGDREIALVPRSLIIDVLRGHPGDFLLINVRGDSMEPDFRHGDQILVDKRDTSPAQPGPFALWDGEWGEYVVKNVERARSGEVRIFSSNTKYSAENAGAETTRIIGRPVWFGRRL